MKDNQTSRRSALKQLMSLGVLGVMSLFRGRPAMAAGSGVAAQRGIPGFRGAVVGRGDENYELWRQAMSWHWSRPKRYPGMIVKARSVEDVVTAVKYAAANKLKVTVRNSGHNFVSPGLRDGALLIDLSALGEIEIDSDKKIASVQPAAIGLTLIQEARKKGFCFPVAHCPIVGLSGFAMGGGIGWNVGHCGGVATFSIEAAEIVTADGEIMFASEKENPELLWAVRGVGPGFFGVVTRLHLKLYRSPDRILMNSYVHPISNLQNVTDILDQVMPHRDDRVEVVILLTHNPAAPPGASLEQSKACVVSATAFASSEEEAKTLLAPFAQSKLGENCQVKAENQPHSFEQLFVQYFGMEEVAARRARYSAEGVFTNEPGKILHSIAEKFINAPSSSSHVIAEYGLNLKHHDDACFSGLGTDFIGCYAIWDHEADDPANYAWIGQLIPSLDQHATGHYINEKEAEHHPERYRLCFTDENWARLEALRRKYDPNGVFHHYLGHS